MRLVVVFTSVLVPLLCSVAQSKNYYGRASFGSFTARERFENDTTGSDKNDYINALGRLYFTSQDSWLDNDEFSFDIRDRYSLFDKLNKEQLSLEERNIFQVNKFYYGAETEWGQWKLGRVPVKDAGGVFVDGVVLEGSLTDEWRLGALTGLNPKRSDQIYVQGNSESTIHGIYTTYQPSHLDWRKNLLVTQGLVSQQVKGEEDRRFYNQSITYQWSTDGQLIETLYVDFIPRTNVQTGSFTWLQDWIPNFSSRVNLLGVDVVEYSRRQGVRERLAASPYREQEVAFILGKRAPVSVEVGSIAGKRYSDQLTKTDTFAKVRTTRELFSRQLFELKLGSRKNFNSQDLYAQGSWSFYNRTWEFVLDVEQSREEYFKDITLHGKAISSNFIYLSSKNLYLSGELQYAGDERVNISTIFFRMNYRFGSTELPPLRDGAPPASRL